MEETYGPADFAGDLAGASATILPWVGAGVGGAIAIALVFIGIRKGLAFFRGQAR